MALSSFFSLSSQKMDYLSQRETVLAGNIANADTPDFKPSDMAKSFEAELQNSQKGGQNGALALAVTQAQHLTGTRNGSGTYGTQPMKNVYEVKPSGNAVVLEQQLLYQSDTNAQYQVASTLYKKFMGFLKTALSRGS